MIRRYADRTVLLLFVHAQREVDDVHRGIGDHRGAEVEVDVSTVSHLRAVGKTGLGLYTIRYKAMAWVLVTVAVGQHDVVEVELHDVLPSLHHLHAVAL